MLGGSAALAVAATLTACSGGSSGDSGPAGGVYLLNFKPEAEEAFKTIAATYTNMTGVAVKVAPPPPGTTSRRFRARLPSPTRRPFSILTARSGLATWKDYALDLSDTDFVKALTDKSMALTDDEGRRLRDAAGDRGVRHHL